MKGEPAGVGMMAVGVWPEAPLWRFLRLSKG